MYYIIRFKKLNLEFFINIDKYSASNSGYTKDINKFK